MIRTIAEVVVFLLFAAIPWLLLRHRANHARQGENDVQVGLFATADPSIQRSSFRKFEQWFYHQVILSRVPLAESAIPFVIVGSAAVLAMMVLIWTDNPILSVTLFGTGIAVCLLALLATAQWKVRQFRKQLPLAMDIMAGAVRSGDSLRDAVRLLADTLDEPAKTEFTRCRNQLEMGLSLRATMKSLTDRIGTVDAKMFGTTLAVHRETGGELTATLHRMAKVLRSRFEYERFMQTTTGVGRMSILVVIALAWFICGYLFFMQPEYGRDLWETPLGQQMLLGALALEIVGILWALVLVRAKY